VEIWGDGSVVRDYLYVSDAVEGILAAHRQEGPTGLYNIASGRGTSLNELVEAIRRVTGRTFEVHYRGGRAFDVPANVLDVSRAERELGWRPAVPLEEGLRRTWEWLEEASAP
jgi:UDP-glucose 4-epimerase